MWCTECACERPANHDHETNDGLGWSVSIQWCWFCGHEQVSVYPADATAEQFECAECGLMTAIVSDEPGDIAAVGAV